MSIPTLELPLDVVSRLEEHALSEAPRECCGILVGRYRPGIGPSVEGVIEAENRSSQDPSGRYEIAPEAVLAAERTVRVEGREILGYYHSHPSGSSAPSALDLARAWPDMSYVILAVKGTEVVSIRSWRLAAGGSRLVEESIVASSIT